MWRPLIRVVPDDGGATLRYRHIEGIEHDMGVHGVTHAPAHHASAELVEDDGEVQQAGRRREERAVRVATGVTA